MRASSPSRGLERVRAIHPYWLVAAIVLITASALAGIAWAMEQRDEARFRNAVEAVQDGITVRLEAYVSFLEATRSLFLSHGGDVELAEFRAFVDAMDLEHRYPGIQGVGFTRRIAPGEVDAVLDELSRQGQVPFRVWPEHLREEYHAIVFLEPMDRRNRAAIGYDMFTEEVRREAMARARDTGRAATSGRVTLVQEIEPRKQAGFLIYVPIYRGGIVPADVESRRRALLGFVYSPFRGDDLMKGIFGTQREPRVNFDLYDGIGLEEPQRIYQGIPPGSRGARETILALEVGGRRWSLHVASAPAFERDSSGRFLKYLLALGLLVNLAFFFAARSQVSAQREEAAAHARLQILVETSKRFADAAQELPQVLKTICREVAQRLTESCTLTLLNAEGTHLELAETFHLEPEAEEAARVLLGRAPIPVGETSLGRVAATGEPLLIPVVPHESLAASTRPEYREHLRRFPVGSLLIVPLKVGERIIGALTVSRRPGLPPYNLKDQQLLEELAERAAIAVENARLTQRLQQAVRLRDDFLSVAGHELRTPLAALQLQVEGLLRQLEKGAMGPVPPRLVERLARARTQVLRLEVLIAGLLDVSRIAGGKLVLQSEEVELTALLSEVIDRFSEHLSRAGCEVSVQAGERLVGRWDRVRLDQVFTNLVSNAAKYGAGKPIQIRIARENDHARIAVQDHGIGISPEDRRRIFGRFERAVPERNYGGLGLGLWISRQIVEALGGHIELESEVGAGSTFTVELPLEQPGAEAPR